LIIEDLHGGYSNADSVVKGVSLYVKQGEVVTIVGPNGAGKSTVLKLAAGLLPSKRGLVLLGDRDVTAWAPQQIARAGLALVPQERNVFASMTVRENLRIGGRLAPQRDGSFAQAYGRLPVLKDISSFYAGALSGGQRQILALGMALMATPSVLLVDEPTAGVSPQAALELLQVIRGLANSGVAVLMVEQNAIQALEISDRGEVLVDGRSVRSDSGPDLIRDPEINRLFLGGNAGRKSQGA
jgi:branched-chain amino acid transport system ATP-binding protein/neutral amino acid transport system ATP-binding protein